jgi:hypothetical protein
VERGRIAPMSRDTILKKKLHIERVEMELKRSLKIEIFCKRIYKEDEAIEEVKKLTAQMEALEIV